MDSFSRENKGYNKLNQNENHDINNPYTNYSTPKSKKTIIFFIIFLTLIIGSLILALFHTTCYTQKHHTESTISVTRAIQLVCNVTQHHDSCVSSLSSLNTKTNPDPEFLFSLSLQSAISELTKLKNLPESLSQRVGESRTRAALGDCTSLFEEALSRVNQTVGAVGGHVASSQGVSLSEVNTWISGAMTDIETCLDGLEETGAGVLEEVKGKVAGSTISMSNSLAILVNIMSLVDKFHLLNSDGHSRK